MVAKLKCGNPPHHLTKEDRIKAGKTRTPARKKSQQLRRLKEKSLKGDDVSKRLYAMLKDGEMSSVEVLKFIDSCKLSCVTGGEKNGAARNMLDWHKMQHGTKDKNVVNVQVNVMSAEQREEELKRVMEEDDG